MEFVLIIVAAFGASLLTFFSGFGLGTILLPVFVLFFPIHVAIALTAICHLINNIFKLILVGKNIDYSKAIGFGISSIIGAFLGAYLLVCLMPSQLEAKHDVDYLKLVIGILMILFSLYEVLSFKTNFQLSNKTLYLGGLLSGFLGGLSGHQGALRSIFLIKTGLSKEEFIATGTAIAIAVDLTRLSIYSDYFMFSTIEQQLPILSATVFAAVLGAIVGKKLLKKISLNIVNIIIAICVGLIGAKLIYDSFL